MSHQSTWGVSPSYPLSNPRSNLHICPFVPLVRLFGGMISSGSYNLLRRQMIFLSSSSKLRLALQTLTLISMASYSVWCDWRTYSILTCQHISFCLNRNIRWWWTPQVNCIQCLYAPQTYGQPPHSGKLKRPLWGSRGLPVTQVIKVNESESWKLHVLPGPALCQMSWGGSYLEIMFTGISLHVLQRRPSGTDPQAKAITVSLLCFSLCHCVCVCREG